MRTSTGLVRQRIEPPPLWNSDTSTSTISKPQSSSCARTRSGQAGITIVRPMTMELAANVVSASSSVSTNGLRHQLHQRRRRRVVERRRADDRAGRVERAEREVHVVHAGVGDPEAAHADAEVGGEVLEARAPRCAGRSRRPGSRRTRTRRRPRSGRRRRRDRRTTWCGRARRTTAARSRSPSDARRSACATSRRGRRRRPRCPRARRRARGSSRRPCRARPRAASIASTVPPRPRMVATRVSHCSRARTGSGWSARSMNGLIGTPPGSGRAGPSRTSCPRRVRCCCWWWSLIALVASLVPIAYCLIVRQSYTT